MAYRLAERRRTRRRRAFVSLFILFMLLLAAAIYGLQQNAVRISHIEVSEDVSLSAYATRAMQGHYFGVIPRDSIFFFPEERIRADILASYNDIAAVSVSRNGFTGISIKADYRVPIARWCGDATRLNLVADCYVFDTDGFIYSTTTTTQPINSFVVYEALPADAEPVGSTLPFSKNFPAIFDFARQLSTLGSPVISVSIHDGEVDHVLASGTRVTYVLGRERDAFTALVSARDNINLANGSVDYVDLRFDGKVYLKKK
ncbi:hypothetical protein HYT04_00310 [Candidatus Kaiserbacteria bacterium]|nr:hypothetical protein [Candidatus Kaiserbacteria bacterium]